MNQIPHQQLIKLEQWSLMTITGGDAVDFLQNQLTNSVKTLPIIKHHEIATIEQNRFAGYCSPKGRLMASFWMSSHQIKQDGSEVPQIRLFVSRDLIASVAKRLSMYVLRAKAKVQDVSDTQLCYGFWHDASRPSSIPHDFLSAITQQLDAHVLELPQVTSTGSIKRYLISISCDQEIALNHIANKYSLHTSVDYWNWLEVLSAIPRITSKTYEQFVPQMVNMESLKGIDFQKGCYPGQEIVARSQYRGTIKRRLQLAHIHNAYLPDPGTEIFHSADPEQPCGMVVLAAQHPLNTDQVDLQVECKLEALETGTVHLSSSKGPLLSFDPLPYPLVEI